LLAYAWCCLLPAKKTLYSAGYYIIGDSNGLNFTTLEHGEERYAVA
jgi:hypothetical protein